MRLAGRFAWVVAVAIAAAIGGVLLVAHPRWSLQSLAGDDAGYYFAIARNVVLGHGFSFDRINPTNGFNPLQTLILIGVFGLLGSSVPVALAYRAGVLLSWLAFAIAAIPYARLVRGFLDDAAPSSDSPARRADVRRLALGAALTFYAGFLALKNVYGQDAPLVLLIGTTFLVRVMSHGLAAPGVRAGLVDGALLGALFLARVDSLPLIAAAWGMLGLAALRRRALARPLLLRVAATVAVVTPYLLWNQATFGMWLPVSARIKSSFPDASLAKSLDVIRGTSLNPADQAGYALAFVLALMVLAREARARVWNDVPLAGPRGVLLVMALYLTGRLGYMLLFSRSDVQGGYVILAHVFNVLVAIRAAATLASRRGERALAWAGAGLLALALGLFAMKAATLASSWRRMVPGGPGDEWALAGAIHARTAPGDVLYGGSFGLLGFLADRPWINGDGVANTLGYQQALRDDALEPWLAAHGVTHVAYIGASHQAPERRTLEVHSGLYGTKARLPIDESRLVIVWPTPRGGPGAEVRLARWSPPAPAAARP